MVNFAGKFLRELREEPFWSTANYFIDDDSAGVLEFDHVRDQAGPPRALPDCVQFLLSKGPKFVIRRKRIPSSDKFAIALQEFERKVLCAVHFAGDDQNSDVTVHASLKSQIQRLRCPSTWWPPFSPCISSAQVFLEAFKADVWERFRKQIHRHRPSSNLSAIDRLGLYWLKLHNYAVIKDDKGTALIPMKGSYLHGLKHRACSNSEQFEIAVCDRANLAHKLRSAISGLDTMITPRSTLVFLDQQVDADWKLMEICLTWKSHKPIQVPRVITPTTSSILTPMAQYVRMRLSPIVSKLEFVLRDSAQLVSKLEDLVLPDLCILGSGDIIDFYPSTTPDMVAKNVFIALSRAGYADALAVADLAHTILQHQFVAANGTAFRCKRVGQGLAFASEACDITAAHLLEQNTSLLPVLREAIFYGRFGDDVVIILKGSLDSDIPNQFEALFNGCSNQYQAKFSWSTSCITSLDVKIIRHASRLMCQTHFKPTNLFRYLPCHSNHPATVFRSWIGAEIRRYVITNSSFQSFSDTMSAFKDRLHRCGYDDALLQPMFEHTQQLYQQRSGILRTRGSGTAKPRVVSLIIPFDPFFVRMGLSRIVRQIGETISEQTDFPAPQGFRTLVAFSSDANLLHSLRRLMPNEAKYIS